MTRINGFQKWALLTTVATYMLITIGGLVRASGAGLGCPDWPTCFGKPYPPLTHEEFLQREIPADFNVDEFHVTLAWIEWLNRLSGSVIGLLIIGTLAYALKDHRKNKFILYPTIAAFITVLVNGWLGSVVVESKLEPVVISAHLLLALVQVSLLLYATVAAFYPEGSQQDLPPQRQLLARGALVVLFLLLIQVGLGADLRGQLENIEGDNPQMERGDWIHEANWIDPVHRSFSWTILLGVAWMGFYAHKRVPFHPYLRYATQLAGLLVLVQVTAGIGLAYVNLPPPLQAVHVVTASLMVGIVTLIYLLATRLPIQKSSGTVKPYSNVQSVNV
ncbi:MAG: COX15/CtaA family protein [Anaerolineae bacterium]|nr:COX15/CtaA family protein [Anaerolineae bacterium]